MGSGGGVDALRQPAATWRPSPGSKAAKVWRLGQVKPLEGASAGKPRTDQGGSRDSEPKSWLWQLSRVAWRSQIMGASWPHRAQPVSPAGETPRYRHFFWTLPLAAALLLLCVFSCIMITAVQKRESREKFYLFIISGKNTWLLIMPITES